MVPCENPTRTRFASVRPRRSSCCVRKLSKIATVDRIAAPVLLGPDDVLDLDRALDRLAALNARQQQVVEMRFFGGYTFDEIADALAVSVSTVPCAAPGLPKGTDLFSFSFLSFVCVRQLFS